MSTPSESGPEGRHTAPAEPGGPVHGTTGFTEVPAWVPIALALWATEAFVGTVPALLVAVVGGFCWLLVNLPPAGTGSGRGDGAPPTHGPG